MRNTIRFSCHTKKYEVYVLVGVVVTQFMYVCNIYSETSLRKVVTNLYCLFVFETYISWTCIHDIMRIFIAYSLAEFLIEYIYIYVYCFTSMTGLTINYPLSLLSSRITIIYLLKNYHLQMVHYMSGVSENG